MSGSVRNPLESSRDFVAVRRKPVKGASVRNIWWVLAEVGKEVCCPGKRSQTVGVSEIDHVRAHSALVYRFLTLNVSGDSPIKRHLVAG
jgi:hypothetical protein